MSKIPGNDRKITQLFSDSSSWFEKSSTLSWSCMELSALHCSIFRFMMNGLKKGFKIMLDFFFSFLTSSLAPAVQSIIWPATVLWKFWQDFTAEHNSTKQVSYQNSVSQYWSSSTTVIHVSDVSLLLDIWLTLRSRWHTCGNLDAKWTRWSFHFNQACLHQETLKTCRTKIPEDLDQEN